MENQNYNIPINIIQCFLGEKDSIDKYPLFQANKIQWINYSEVKGYRYIFITKDNVEEYLGEHKKFYYGLRHAWQRIDFIRYLVLNKIGGIYIDLDCEPDFDRDLFSLFNRDFILNKWFNPTRQKYELNNAVIGCKVGALTSLIKYCREETERVNNMDIYEIRKVRHMLNSTGVRMFKRWAKKEKITYTPEIHDYLTDHCSATWLQKDQFT